MPQVSLYVDDTTMEELRAGATALSHGATFMTNNVNEFERVIGKPNKEAPTQGRRADLLAWGSPGCSRHRRVRRCNWQ